MWVPVVILAVIVGAIFFNPITKAFGLRIQRGGRNVKQLEARVDELEDLVQSLLEEQEFHRELLDSDARRLSAGE